MRTYIKLKTLMMAGALIMALTYCSPPIKTKCVEGEGVGCKEIGLEIPGEPTPELSVSAFPAGGMHREVVSVVLTATFSDAKIYYSMVADNAPQEEAAFLYDSAKPLVIMADTHLQFFASRGEKTTETTNLYYTLDLDDPKIIFEDNIKTHSNVDTSIKVKQVDDDDIKVIKYSINNEDTDLFSSGIVYNEESGIELAAIHGEEVSYKLRIQAFDQVDRASNVLEHEFIVDKKYPEVTFDPAGDIYRSGPNVKLTSESGASLFFVRAVGVAADPTSQSAPIASGASVQIDSDNTTLKVLAVDEAGNAKVFSQAYYIDAQAPLHLKATTNIAAAKQLSDLTQVLTDNFTVVISSGDASDKIYYTLDGTEPNKENGSLYESAIEFVVAEGIEKNTTLKMRAYDKLENFTDVHTVKYLLDRKDPEITVKPDSGVFAKKVEIEVSSSELGYVLIDTNGNDPVEGVSQKIALLQADNFKTSLSLLSPGKNVVKAVVFDRAGRKSKVETRIYTIDSEAPDLVILPTDRKLFNSTFEVTFSSKAEDLSSILFCAVLGGENCTPSIHIENGGSFPISFEGKTKVIAKATDNMGNVFETHKSYEIDKTDPTVSFSPDQDLFGNIEKQTMVITAEEGATIYYTTDGSIPVAVSGAQNVFQGSSPLAVTLFDSATIKAIAKDAAGNVTEHFKAKTVQFDRSTRSISISPAHLGPHKKDTLFSVSCLKEGNRNEAAKAYVAIDQKALPQPDHAYRGALSSQLFPENKDFTLHVLCKDAVSEVERTRKFYIDTIAPELSLHPEPSTVTNQQHSNQVDVSIGVSNKNLDRFEEFIFVSINGQEEYQLTSASILLTETSTVLIRLIDAAGNEIKRGPFRYDVFSDRDGDHIADNVDPCPDYANVASNPLSILDSDYDGIYDVCDNCKATSNAIRVAGTNKIVNGPDIDKDGVGDACDTCRTIENGPLKGSYDQTISRKYGMQAGAFTILEYNDAACDEGRLPMGFCGFSCDKAYCQPTAATDNGKFPPLAGDDSDNDGVRNICDGFKDKNTGQWVKMDQDYDADGFQDGDDCKSGAYCDNCDGVANPKQIDSNGNGVGDKCDGENGIFALDKDKDGFPEYFRLSSSSEVLRTCAPSQISSSGDFRVIIGDKVEGKSCDSCEDNANTTDSDNDGIHDCGEAEYGANLKHDADQDGWDSNDGSAGRGKGIDRCQACGHTDRSGCAPHAPKLLSYIDNSDEDGDTVGKACDNCLDYSNRDRADGDSNGIGDECDVFRINQPFQAKATIPYSLPTIEWEVFRKFVGVNDRILHHWRITLATDSGFKDLVGDIAPAILERGIRSYKSPFRSYVRLPKRKYYVKLEALTSKEKLIESKKLQFEFVPNDSHFRYTDDSKPLLKINGSENEAPQEGVTAEVSLMGGRYREYVKAADHNEGPGSVRFDALPSGKGGNRNRGGFNIKFNRPVEIDKVVMIMPILRTPNRPTRGFECDYVNYRYYTFRHLDIVSPTDSHSNHFSSSHMLVTNNGTFPQQYAVKQISHHDGFSNSGNWTWHGWNIAVAGLGFKTVQIAGPNQGQGYDLAQLDARRAVKSDTFRCATHRSSELQESVARVGGCFRFGKWNRNLFACGGLYNANYYDYFFGLGLRDYRTFPIVQQMVIYGRAILLPGDDGYEEGKTK